MKEFQAVFQLSKTRVFEVKYYTLGGNRHPYFATFAAEFCRNKRCYRRCGQAQEYVLDGYDTAMEFYKKWDPLHLSDLTQEQYDEIRNDLEALQDRYNFILEELDESKRPYHPSFGLGRLAEWTKQTPKKKRRA